MRSAISRFCNVRRIRSMASTLLCFAILAAEAPTVFACTSTYLDIYDDGTYVYAYADMSVSGCNPCYAQIDLTLTSPSNSSAYTSVYNNPGQTYITAQVSLPINVDFGTWTASADYTSDNSYFRTATLKKVPDHVSTLADQQGLPSSCPNGYNAVWWRQMQLQIVDTNNKPVKTNLSVQEQFSNQTANTCPGGALPIQASCQPTINGGTWVDTMTVSSAGGLGCSAGITDYGDACGYSHTSTWSACSNGLTNNLWTSPRNTSSDSVTVNGNLAGWPLGTQLH